MTDIHGQTAAPPAEEAPWGIVCFPGDCMSPVIVFSYPREVSVPAELLPKEPAQN